MLSSPLTLWFSCGQCTHAHDAEGDFTPSHCERDFRSINLIIGNLLNDPFSSPHRGTAHAGEEEASLLCFGFVVHSGLRCHLRVAEAPRRGGPWHLRRRLVLLVPRGRKQVNILSDADVGQLWRPLGDVIEAGEGRQRLKKLQQLLGQASLVPGDPLLELALGLQLVRQRSIPAQPKTGANVRQEVV